MNASKKFYDQQPMALNTYFGPCSLDNFMTSSVVNKSFFLLKLGKTLGSWPLHRPKRVPEGHTTVARRFIAGSETTWGLRPGGTPEYRRAINPEDIVLQGR
jgi:hypothetical protein